MGISHKNWFGLKQDSGCQVLISVSRKSVPKSQPLPLPRSHGRFSPVSNKKLLLRDKYNSAARVIPKLAETIWLTGGFLAMNPIQESGRKINLV